MLSDRDKQIIPYHFDDRQAITIFPVGDVHLGAAEHMTEAWRGFCEWIAKQPRAYIFLLGDLINNATRSGVSNIFEETMRPREQKRVMAELLSPLREKILCIVAGNHELRSSKDADGDPGYDIACKLDLENVYRESLAFVKIQFGDTAGNGLQNPTYIATVAHGSGGGYLTGGGVNKAERFGAYIDGTDLLVLGHTHKPWTTAPAKIRIDARNNKVTESVFRVVSSSSWMDYGGYAARKMYQPTAHVTQEIRLAGDRKEIKIVM